MVGDSWFVDRVSGMVCDTMSEPATKRRRCLWSVLGAAALFVGPAPAWSWGCEGHETIALVASRQLTPHARKMVSELLHPSPIDSHLERACHPSGGNALSDVSTWADDIRHDPTSPLTRTRTWHFIDIPRAATRGDVDRFCPRAAGCIVTAIDTQLATLRKPHAERQHTAEALMLLVHLIGDLHQPLHCTTNNDGGGNCVPVTYFGMAPQLPRDRPEDDVYQPNLHAVWDTGIIRRIVGHRGSSWFADFLQRRFAAQMPAWQRMPIDVSAWAWESHRVAEQTAYGQLPFAIPIASPQRGVHCQEVSQKMLALHEHLGQRYQEAVVPIIEEQLAKAGVRLAMVLNRLWP